MPRANTSLKRAPTNASHAISSVPSLPSGSDATVVSVTMPELSDEGIEAIATLLLHFADVMATQEKVSNSFAPRSRSSPE
jgi:hypothetical protein